MTIHELHEETDRCTLLKNGCCRGIFVGGESHMEYIIFSMFMYINMFHDPHFLGI